MFEDHSSRLHFLLSISVSLIIRRVSCAFSVHLVSLLPAVIQKCQSFYGCWVQYLYRKCLSRLVLVFPCPAWRQQQMKNGSLWICSQESCSALCYWYCSQGLGKKTSFENFLWSGAYKGYILVIQIVWLK